MNPMQAVQSVLSRYAQFGGRARRSEFWWWGLVVGVINLVLRAPGSTALAVVDLLFSLAVIVPGLAVGWRRMHDIGRAGPWILIGIIPIIGWILVIVWACQDSQPGDNQFGPNPKGVGGGGFGQPGYGQMPGGYGQAPGGYGHIPGAYGQAPGGYGQAPGYGQPPTFGQPGQ